MPNLALVMCVHNEQDTVIHNLLYHRHLGVTKAYVHLDHCTDDTAARLERLDWVEVIEFPRADNCAGLPYHQNLCAINGMNLARKDGHEWLLHIDPDEYAWGDNASGTVSERANLLAMLKRARAETELVHLIPKEVLPQKELGDRPFWVQCYFQVPGKVAKRDILDPTSGEIRALEKWAGHTIGKSIVCTTCNAEPLYAHSWKRSGADASTGKLITEQLGFHYHYAYIGARLWREKYTKLAWEPDTWITGGEVPFPKQAWKEAAQKFSIFEAEEYYENWVAMDEAELERRVEIGEAIKDTNVVQIMSLLDSR